MTNQEFNQACIDGLDNWIPAAGGTEVPFYTRTHHKVLYCYNPAERRHAYLDLGSDLVIDDDSLWSFGLGPMTLANQEV